MAPGYLTLGDIAARTPIVNVGCNRCARKGRYRTADLVARYGPDYPGPQWLRLVSADCPRRLDPHPSIYELCGVHCVGLAEIMR